MEEHPFWSKQPVQRETGVDVTSTGLIDEQFVKKLKQEKEPTSVELFGTKNYYWKELDLESDDDLDLFYSFLKSHYRDSEDDIVLDYSKPFIKWCLRGSGSDLIIALMNQKNNVVGTIAASPIKVMINGKKLVTSQVTFMCVHRGLRGLRISPFLIDEINRRIHQRGLGIGSLFTAKKLPFPEICAARYYHFPLNFPLLISAKFVPDLGNVKNRLRRNLYHRLQNKFYNDNIGFVRLLTENDNELNKVYKFYKKTPGKLIPVFDSVNEFRRYFFEGNPWNWVYTFNGEILGFASFYHLNYRSEETAIEIQALNLLYFYSIQDADTFMSKILVQARRDSFDVVNMLNVCHMQPIIEEFQFIKGTGESRYYIYNYRTSPIDHVDNFLVLP